MSTEWFETRREDIPGLAGVRVLQGSEELGDPTTLLITPAEDLPDWVRTPAEIGGQQLRVIGQSRGPCPVCKEGPAVRHIHCEQGFFVAECAVHGFAWYKR